MGVKVHARNWLSRRKRYNESSNEEKLWRRMGLDP